MQNRDMNEIILFGEKEQVITSSCTTCSGCSDKNENLCTGDTQSITSEELTSHLKGAISRANLEERVSVEFKDIHSEDLTDYPDVKTLINMSFSFPILTLNKEIKYMGPFEPEVLLKELKENFI